MSAHDEFAEQVMKWTRAKLEADPVATASDLYSEACDRFPELEALSVRQYRVRYVVKVNRELARDDAERARERKTELPDWVTPPGQEPEDEEPTQREMFAREDGG